MSISNKIAELNTQRAKALERFYGGTKIVTNAEAEIASLSTQLTALIELRDANSAASDETQQ